MADSDYGDLAHPNKVAPTSAAPIDWEAVTEDLIKMLYCYIPGMAIVDEVHAVIRKHRAAGSRDPV